MDMDGDGKSDLISIKDSESGKKNKMEVYRSISGSFDVSVGSGSIEIPTSTQSITFQNFNRSNYPQSKSPFLGFMDYSTYKFNLYSYKGSISEKLLTRTVNSFGVETIYSFVSINDPWVCTYTPSQISYPYSKRILNMDVLFEAATYLNGVQIDSKVYEYKDPIIHNQGLGFRGFQNVTMKDRSGTTIQTYNPMDFGVLTSVDSPTLSATYKYDVNVAPNKTAKITLINKTEKGKLSNTSITSSYTYDTYGNPLTETIDYGEGIKSATTNIYNNHNTISLYKLGELASQTIRNERALTSVLSKTEIAYNVKRLPLSKKIYYNNNLTSEEAYTYNVNNYLIESKSRAYTSPNWLPIKYTYDALGRIIRQTDVDAADFKLFTDYIYNAKGQLSSTKDQKGLETKYEYDNWGRGIKTIGIGV